MNNHNIQLVDEQGAVLVNMMAIEGFPAAGHTIKYHGKHYRATGQYAHDVAFVGSTPFPVLQVTVEPVSPAIEAKKTENEPEKAEKPANLRRRQVVKG